MEISQNNWLLSLDLVGGRIRDLSWKGRRVLGTYKRIDGKMGNTHVCIPSFDKEGEKYDLPFHGLVRTIPWTIKAKSSSVIIISCRTPSSKLYPAELTVEQEFSIDDMFIHTIRVTNCGGSEVPTNIGCHYYWDTPKGWDTIRLNGREIKADIETNGVIDLKERNIIDFPHARYELITNGFRSAVLWTSFLMDTQGSKKFSQDFCCIEPVVQWPNYFGTTESMLKLGEKKTVSLSIGAGGGPGSTLR